MSWSTSELSTRLGHRWTGLSPPVKSLTDRSKAVLRLWIFYVFSVICLLCLYARLFIYALWSSAGKELTSWLLFVVSHCEIVTFPLVSWVRCGTWLYHFLIFAPLLTLTKQWRHLSIRFFLSYFQFGKWYEGKNFLILVKQQKPQSCV